MIPMAHATDPRVMLLFDQLGGMLTLTRALAESGRRIDLAGLDDLAGRLCAACLDLPPEDGRAFRPRLVALMEDVNAIAAACRAVREGAA